MKVASALAPTAESQLTAESVEAALTVTVPPEVIEVPMSRSRSNRGRETRRNEQRLGTISAPVSAGEGRENEYFRGTNDVSSAQKPPYLRYSRWRHTQVPLLRRRTSRCAWRPSP